jgi:hypothetical protein
VSGGFELAGRRFVIPVPITGVAEDGARCIAGLIPPGETRLGDDAVLYDMTPWAADLSLVASGRAPVLVEHLRYFHNVLGALTSAWFDGPVLCFTARLAPVPEADNLWTLLAAGFPISLSGGFEIEVADVLGPSPWGGQRIAARQWKLTEVSAVPFGRNPGAYMVSLASAEGRELAASRRPDAEAIRQRLRLDRWTCGWPHEAGRRLAARLGTDPAETGRLLAAEVAARADQMVVDLAA